MAVHHALLALETNEEVRGGLLLLAFGLLLLGAEVFTNGVEWLGHRLGVSESATGSVLAAMGTALPETTIPVVAVVEGGQAADHVGVGAILGAPFMLATVATFLVGASVLAFAGRRQFDGTLHFDPVSTRRDLSFFLVGYTLAFVAALVDARPFRVAIAAVLVLLYVAYLYRSLSGGELADGEGLDPLHLGRTVERGLGRVGRPDGRDHATDPHVLLVGVQTLVALALVVVGARLFVTEVEWLSETVLHVPTAVVALLVAPVATELPETFNSVLWLARDKDTLALNNVTGAMAFQGTLPVTLGILFTSWNLHLAWGTAGFLNAVSVAVAVASAGVVFVRAVRTDGTLNPRPFLVGGVLYLGFVALTLGFVLTGSLSA